ncbi:MAG TPA: LysE family transporter [Kofleriaceae bacterium]
MLSFLMFLLIGAAAGGITGVPIGPANVAVIDAAYRHTMRRAYAVCAGAALGDGICAGVGVLGVKPWLQSHPSLPPFLWALSGVVLLIYGIVTMKSQAAPASAPTTAPDEPTASESMMHRHEKVTGFKIGLALILLNPAAIVTWIFLMAASWMPSMAGRLDGLATALGVIAGSFGWFSLVAHLTHRGKNVLGQKAAMIPKIVGALLVVYAVYLLAKAAHYALG